MARLEDYIDLSKYPNLAPEHKDALNDMMHGAMDDEVPSWFQAHCTTMFELIASGCERTEEIIARAKMQGVRGSLAEWDVMGLPPDDLEESA